MLEQDVFCPQKKPYGYLTEALDQLRPNDVYFATGAARRCALGGAADRNSQSAPRRRRSRRWLYAGYAASPQSKFFLYLPRTGEWAQDSRHSHTMPWTSAARLKSDRSPTITDGDVVFADVDGVLIIPRRGALQAECIGKAIEKASR